MIKAGVDLRGLKPQVAIAYTIACMVYQRYGQPCWITSGSDGKHGPQSLHYQGAALDLRTRHLTIEQIPLIYRELKLALGEQFDVVLEPDHIHVEFDPKEKAKQSDEA